MYGVFVGAMEILPASITVLREEDEEPVKTVIEPPAKDALQESPRVLDQPT